MKQKKTILLIEDDIALVNMYKTKLRDEGFRVITVTDGRKAITKTKQGADLILLDILMPNLNGFEILKRIKAQPKLSRIPVIVLTNIGSESIDNDKNLAISLGAVDYMIKSLNTPESVVASVRAHLASIR
jgi:DNA-binding response OmpR family regulator